MNPLPKFLCTVLLSAFALAAAPAAQAQVGVSINIGSPAWGPPAPYGAQYYYIPEIDGYYDLYAQQYIVYQDGYWVPLPQLYGYDPYQFHPVVIEYRGREPWRQLDYYHSRYAYQPYRVYSRGRDGYYPSAGYGRPGYARAYDNRGGYSENRGYDNHNQGQYSGGNRGYSNSPYQNGGYNRSNGGQSPQGQAHQGGGRGDSGQGRGGYSRSRRD
ncbi:hypothetical protein Q3A66_01335 [Hymenobacter sp. BT770]|uniref:hypothetical protein n=1 Tax=Hymenobacter sp. BT770 TaxID=2886942 RepID=UPI001D102C87|nr:hypothetical protein [Hymenobacter sp. BT770]MCC3153730.1 hypothetical protein [Hymenobacter sp. BT770]MDO3413694.1 hypothetical protein [Hymenobacter sp. BT770]